MKGISEMKRVSLFLAAALLPSLFLSCSKQGDGCLPSIRTEDGQVTEIPVSVLPFEGIDGVKSVLDSGGNFTWEDDDKVGFIPYAKLVKVGETLQQMFYLRNDRFVSNGWGLLPDSQYYCYYPYSELNTASSVTVCYDGQRMTANGSYASLGAFDYLHNSQVDVPRTGEINVKLRHIGCILRFRITVPEEYCNERFTRFTIDDPSGYVINSGTYDPAASYSSDSNSGETVTFTTTEHNHSFVVDLGPAGGNGIQPDESRVVEVVAMMAPAQWGGKTLSYTLEGPQTPISGTFSPASDQIAGKRYTYTSDGGGGVTDLSKVETANCYIVANKGKYRFRCDVKGNGVSVGGKATAIGTPVSAFVLWETVNTLSAPARGSIVTNVEYRSVGGHGYVYFEKPDDTAGNAAIVLMDVTPELDGAYSMPSCYSSNGHTMWLWHIWCPGEQPADDDYVTKVFMDRNLGALSKDAGTPLSMGMLYQWGRPDPMTGAASFDNNNPAKAMYAYHLNPGYLSDEVPNMPNGSGPHETGTCISFPLQYFCGGDLRHWSNENQTTLWGSSKTMYDPCPPGYKIPSDFSDLEFSDVNARGGKVRYNNGSNRQSSWFFWPMTGIRGLELGTKTLKNVCVSAQYWDGRAFVDPNLGKYVGNNLNINSNGVCSNCQISYVISGNPVRCQKAQ